MKILRVIHSAHPRSGGPINGVLEVTPLLAGHGIETSLVSLDRPDDGFWENLPIEGTGVGPGWGSYGFARALDRYFESRLSTFDLVVIHGLWQYHALAAARACRRHGKPYVVYPHGMLDPWFKRRYPLKHLKKWCYWPWADYRTLRGARAVLFTTPRERDLARESFWLYGAKEWVSPYGVADAPGWEGKDVTDSFLLYLGRIHPKKGLDHLLAAYAAWKPARKRPLRIAGPIESAYARRLRDWNVDGVEWLGPTGRDDKWKLLQDAEALVLPSHQENFGMVVAESLAVGTPVLTTWAVNTAPELECDGAGLVESDDAAGVARLLQRWETLAAEDRAAMSLRARLSFEKRYDLGPSASSLAHHFHLWAG